MSTIILKTEAILETTEETVTIYVYNLDNSAEFINLQLKLEYLLDNAIEFKCKYVKKVNITD